MTERVGLFGWPLGHSVSAPMRNAAFDTLGADMAWVTQERIAHD